MRITVTYETQLKRAVGTASEEFVLPDEATVSEAIQAISDRHGKSLSRMLLNEDGAVRPSVLVFVADEQVTPDDSVNLTDGASITLMSPISGG